MFTKRFIIVLLAVVVTVASCAPKSAPTASPSTPPPQPTATPSVVCPCFEGLSSGLDNATQARIRVVLSIKGEPRVDVYVNGLPASNGGKLQQNIGWNQFSGFLYVTPGTYTVALVPHGGSLSQALFEPVEVKAEAGHRYTVATVGQVADKDVKGLVVDETALEVSAGVKATDNAMVEINNVKGAPAIDELINGKAGVLNIPYGGMKAGICAIGSIDDRTIVTGHPEIILFDGNSVCEPGVSFFYPPSNDSATKLENTEISQGTSELNVLDFLAGFSSHAINIDGHAIKFDTLLAAIDKADLRDQLLNGGPYLLLVPTDDAFAAALPKDKLDALLNDPQALTQLLGAHLVDGYYPWGSLSGATYGISSRMLTNRLGQELNFQGDFVNGLALGPNYTVGNGIRVQIIYTLLKYK